MEQGILERNGGNTQPAPPTITDGGPISGTACANCLVDVFADDADEGRTWHGSATADASGAWSLTLITNGPVYGPAITATSTNAAHNTSPFSGVLSIAQCSPGTFGATGLPPCTPASAGHYVPTWGATAQTPCPTGTFSGTTGASACKPCPAGASTGGQTGQAACLSISSATGAGPVSFAASAGSLASPTAIAESSLPTAGKPAGVSFPFGFFGWTLTGLTPGDTITLTISYPQAVAAGSTYWKVLGNAWVDASTALGSNDGDNVVTLTLIDGGPFDADRSANGSISDPGGIGEIAVAPTRTLTVSLAGSGSGTVTSSPAGIDCPWTAAGPTPMARS